MSASPKPRVPIDNMILPLECLDIINLKESVLGTKIDFDEANNIKV